MTPTLQNIGGTCAKSAAGGGKAKAVVGWNRETDQFLAGDRGLPDGFEHWIVKFTPPEYPYRGRFEYEIMQKARAAGIETSECRLFELDGIEHFMTKRFDRDGQKRHHVQTLAAIAHLPTGMGAEVCSYDNIFSVIDDLGLGYESKITDDDLLAVADRFAIGTAQRVLREVKSALA